MNFESLERFNNFNIILRNVFPRFFFINICKIVRIRILFLIENKKRIAMKFVLIIAQDFIENKSK